MKKIKLQSGAGELSALSPMNGFLSTFSAQSQWKPIQTQPKPIQSQSEPNLQGGEAILDFVRTRLNFFPDAQQERVLVSTAKRGILNCTRQWGKSTVCAAKAVHRAYTRPGCLVLVASPGERQSAEFLRKTAALVRALKIAPRGDGDNPVSLLFPNGSRIVGLPGTEATVRGFSSVSLLLIDEASLVDDAMYKSLRPMLAVANGDLWMMSTPRGRRGFFHDCWVHDAPNWERISVPATECPRISKEFLEQERAQIGLPWFRQEYLCEFIDNGLSVFGRDLVEGALDTAVTPLPIDSLGTNWDEEI